MKTIIAILSLMLASWEMSGQWVQTSGPPGGGNIYELMAFGDNVLAGESNGIFLSTNRGETWKHVAPEVSGALAFAIQGTNVFAGPLGGGVLRSSDNGVTWKLVNVGLPENASINSLAVGGANIFSALSSKKGIFVSEDDGNSWSKVNEGWENFTHLAYLGDQLYAAVSDEGVFRSSDRGHTWTPLNTGLTDLNILTSEVIGSNLFIGTLEEGAFVLSEEGSFWVHVDMGLTYLAVSEFAEGGTNIYAATNQGVLLSIDNGISWIEIGTGLPLFTGISSIAASGSSVIAGYYGQGIFSSHDNGNTWHVSNTGIPATEVKSLAVNGATIFAGTIGYGLFTSNDNGSTWEKCGTGVFDDMDIKVLVVDGNHIFAGTSIGIYVSEDNGNNWTECAATGEVTSIAISGSRVLVGNYYGGVFLSPDYGATWSQVNNGLPDVPVYSVAISGNTLFAGTRDGGVYFSEDNGGYWIPSNTGLTNLFVTTLAITDLGILAGTFGDGLFLSTDNGGTWTPFGFYGFDIHSLAINGPQIFFGTYWQGGTFYSLDNGATWDHFEGPYSLYGVLSFAFRGHTVFAGTEGGGVFMNSTLLTSTDQATFDTHRINIYPNPASNYITIEVCDISGDAHLSIFNINGQKVLDQHITEFQTNVDISSLLSGMYFLRITNDGLVHTQKLLKE